MKAVDLFCGTGGAARGMHEAGFDVMFGVDRDDAALRSYNESLPGDPIQHDLRIIRRDILPPLNFDLLHGSPPCQGFSQAKGYRDLSDRRNQLVWRFVEWVDALRPKAVTMENVPGMATISNTFMDRVTGTFRDIGYATKWRELNAADYGVPQTRRRIFVVGFREDVPTPSRWFPRPTHAEAPTSTFGGRRLKPWRTVREAIGDLFLLADGGVMTSQQNEGHQAAGRRPMHGVDEPARTIRGGTPPLVIPNHEPVTPGENQRQQMLSYAPGSTHDSVTERRLAGDRPAFTVAANHTSMIVGEDIAEEPSATVDTGGWLYERGHHYNQTEARVRRLTVREAARIQSFPDDHYFVGTKTEQLRQVGNAVPPRLMFQIARLLRDFIEDADRRNAGGRSE